MYPDVSNDSEEVRGFLTLGGQVDWAVNAYKYLDAAARAEAQEPLTAASDQYSETEYMQAPTEDEFWGQFKLSSTLSEDGAYGSLHTTAMDEEMNDIPIPAPSQSQALPLDHDATFLAVHTRTLSDTQVTARHPQAPSQTPDPHQLQASSSSAHVDSASAIDAAVLDTPGLAPMVTPPGPSRAKATHWNASTESLTATQLTVPLPQATPPPSRLLRPQDSSPSTQTADFAEHDLDTSGRVPELGPTRDKGKAVARSSAALPYARKSASRAVAAPATQSHGKRTRAYCPLQNPPPGWATYFRKRRDANWVWNGKAIPQDWEPGDVWDKLRQRYKLSKDSLCRWKGCSAPEKAGELRKHTLGKHLGCSYRCLGCACVCGRYDNWKRTLGKTHKKGCPTDAFHRGLISQADFEARMAAVPGVQGQAPTGAADVRVKVEDEDQEMEDDEYDELEDEEDEDQLDSDYEE